MKCEILRDDIEISPDYPDEALSEFHRAQVVVREILRNGAMAPVRFWKVGAILDAPDAYMMVRQGCAKPADPACASRARRSVAQQADAQKAYERVSKGIHPDDYELFDSGIIDGYMPNGDFKPGPNWELMPKPEENEEEE